MNEPTLPLRDFDDLTAALGPDATLVLRGRRLPVEQCRGLVPAYYFPIISPGDLASKLADLAVPADAEEDFLDWARRALPERGDTAAGWS